MSGDLQRQLEQAEQLYSIGQLDGAIGVLRRVLSEDPDLAEAHAWLAACLIRKRRLHAATVEARIALTLAPESTLARWVGAEIELARRDFAAARHHVDALLADSPDVPGFHRLKARCLALSGHGKERLPVLEEALRHGPDDPETLAEIARYYAGIGNLDLAFRFATDALNVEPENLNALVAMGNTLLLNGDVDGAREHAVLALRNDPSDPDALQLMTSIKARTHPLLGIWWHYAVWSERMGPTRNILVLLGAFVLYRIGVIAASGAGETALAAGVQIAWLALVVYSFAGPTLFRKALQRELAAVQLKRF